MGFESYNTMTRFHCFEYKSKQHKQFCLPRAVVRNQWVWCLLTVRLSWAFAVDGVAYRRPCRSLWNRDRTRGDRRRRRRRPDTGTRPPNRWARPVHRPARERWTRENSAPVLPSAEWAFCFCSCSGSRYPHRRCRHDRSWQWLWIQY